jgi:hypothetical protein
MQSLSQIQQASREAAQKAAAQKKVPFVVEMEDVQALMHDNASGRVHFPFLGDYVPRGWKRTDTEPFFVDATGFGKPGEPALTCKQFASKLVPGRGYAVIEAGEFQVYVAEYVRDDNNGRPVHRVGP